MNGPKIEVLQYGNNLFTISNKGNNFHGGAAFRTIKTGFLEVRPIFVRKESRTRGHLFVTMLAYMLVNTFWKNVRHLGKELHHMIDSLDAIKTVILSEATTTTTTIKRIPEPPDYKKDILKALHIRLPSTL